MGTVRRLIVCAGVFTWGVSPSEARAETPSPPPPPPSEQEQQTPVGFAMGAAPRVAPHLLVQSDALFIRHGARAADRDDPEAGPGLYLRRARVGVDVSAGLWRGRLMVEATAQSETLDTTGAPTATGAPGAAMSAAATPLDPIAGQLARGAPRATEAFVALAAHKALFLAAGSLRVPLGLSRQVDEGDLRLPERARVVVRTTPDYRAGVSASGDLGLLQYALGAYAAAPRFASAGSSFAEGGALYLARLAAEPLGPVGPAPQLRRRDDPWYGWWRFSVGMTAFHARLPGSNEWGLGGDAQFQWRRLCVTGEGLWTRRAPADRAGFTFEPGVFLVPDRLELVTRLEWFNDRIGPPGPADVWGAALGLTFFSVARLMRAQVAYTWRRPIASLPGDERSSGWALLRATFTL